MTQEYFSKLRVDLLQWFSDHKRELPWRKNPHWYTTYLSEVILQQTTVEQGLPYFKRFLDTYPTIQKLASASEQEILQLWSGLGYYSRARNMHKAATVIVKEFNGSFPREYKQALKIPGIGPYSAAAILSLAFNQPHAAIDGNVIRVVSRLFAIRGDISQSKTLNRVKNKAELLLDKDNPGAFNEAIMELGATVCSPQKPLCLACPVKSYCKAFTRNLIKTIPYKSPARAKQKRYQLVFVLQNNSQFLIARKPANGLLAGMWEFPASWLEQAEFNNGVEKLLHEKNISSSGKSPVYRHMYSHIDLKYKAVIARQDHKLEWIDHYVDYKWIGLNEAQQFPIHNAHLKILDWYKSETKNQTQWTGRS